MTISITLLNKATGKPIVYFDKPELDAFTLTISTDQSAPTSLSTLRIRLPVRIFAIDQVAKVKATSAGWATAAAQGPFVTLTPPVGTSLSSASPVVVTLSGMSSTNAVAANDDVEVFAGSEAPTTRIFRMAYPTQAADLTQAMVSLILPDAVCRTPSDFDRIENVLTLRLVNRNPSAALVTNPWVRTPTVLLSFVYGNDIGSLTPADDKTQDPYSALNIKVEVVATYKNGQRTYEWNATPPDTSTPGDAPVWTLQPAAENTAVLGAGSGATAQFRISGLSTSAPAGSTQVYLQYSDFPGYSDGYITLPLAKKEPQESIVYFDGTPSYVGKLNDRVTVQWQTFAIARVALLVGGVPVTDALDAKRGSYSTTISRTTPFSLQAYKRADDADPAHTQDWVAHVPDARVVSFKADKPTVAAGSQVTLSWETAFALDGEIRAGTTYKIKQAELAEGSKPYYPRQPVTYTLHLSGEGSSRDATVDVFVLDRGWSVRRMGFNPNALQGPVLYGTDGGLVLVGGGSDNAVFQSADGTEWEQVSVAEFPARNDAAGCAFGGKYWIMGGTNANGQPCNDVWSSDDAISWTQVTAAAQWSVRSNMACAAFGGKLWLFGGLDMKRFRQSDTWWSTDGANWTQASSGDFHWSARSDAAVTVYDGKLWLFGGSLNHNENALPPQPAVANDLWSSADGVEWTQEYAGGMLGDGPQARKRAVLAAPDGKTLYLFGGIGADGLPLNDFNAWSGGGWDLVTGPANWNVSQAGATVWRQSLWFAGGMSGSASSDAVWSWFDELGTPAARQHVDAVQGDGR